MDNFMLRKYLKPYSPFDMDPYDFNKIGSAMDLARMIHKNQYYTINNKKYPYYHAHISRVAAVLFTHVSRHTTRSTTIRDAVIVALLHDAIEDAKDKDFAINQIGNTFGDYILNCVLLLTNNNNKNQKFEEYIQKICDSGDFIPCIVKIMDRCCNLSYYPIHWKYNKINSYLQNSKFMCDVFKNITFQAKFENKAISSALDVLEHQIRLWTPEYIDSLYNVK